MSTVPRAESRRAYSWWWDSHISPKNSKWLQENLNDMDVKVKSMIKLIEEDADSFARRAEMYYKKRPELMKLVEEFYRAYRALAERYDHATGALRHAHRTMSEAFPNHIPLALPDESLSNNTLEMSFPRSAVSDSDDSPKDTFGFPEPFNAFDRKETYPEKNEALATKKGLKHFNEMFTPRVKLPEESFNVQKEEGTPRVKLPEWRIRKNLNFEEEDENTPTSKIHIDYKNHVQSENTEKENAKFGIKHLQEQVSQLSSENQRLKAKIELESKHLDLSRAHVQNLRDLMSKLESEKDAALLQNQLSDETISSLEIEISKVKNEIRKLNEEMEMAATKLNAAEKQCLALEKSNHSLQLELLEAKSELEELRLSLKEGNEKYLKTEMSLHSIELLYNQSNEKVMHMTLEIQILVEKLKEIERCKVSLEEEVCELKDLNYNLNENNSVCALKIRHLEDEIISLKEINGKLEDEVEIHAESKETLQQELDSLKDDRNELDLKHQSLTKQMEEARLHIESLETLVKGLQSDHVELKECCGKLEGEKLLFLNKLNDMESVSARNSTLENSLSQAKVELEYLIEQIKVLEGSCESLNAAVSTHIGEKAFLASQIEILTENVEKLSVKNTLFENSLDDANTELEQLRLKLRDLEESCRSLSHANTNLVTQKNDLISQVERIQLILTNLETIHATLEEKHLNLENEKDLYVKKVQNLEDSMSFLQKELENKLRILQENRQMREELEAAHQKSFSHMNEIFILQNCLNDTSAFCIIERQKCLSLIQSKEIELSALESQIQFLQEETKVRDSKLKEEEQKSMNFMLEIFILQSYLSEMKGDNFTISQECQKLQEFSRSTDEQIKQLEERNLGQKETISLLMDHILKVRDGFHLLLKPLNINHELMSFDGSEAVIIPTILGEINNLLASNSFFHDENQLLQVEISVYLTLLKQIELEKIHLGQEIEEVNKQTFVLKAELESLTGKLKDSLEDLNNSREEKNTLEEENDFICVEAMTREHLYLFYKNLHDERIQQLKLLNGDMCSLLTIQNGFVEEIKGSKERERSLENENKQLGESLALLEELRTRTTVLEFDVCTASSICEELTLQVEDQDNFLKLKSMELSKAAVMHQSKQEEVDEAKMMRLELEKEIRILLEGAVIKDNQIACVNEENRTLNDALNRFKVEVDMLKMTERSLSFELLKERAEVEQCEGEMMKLFSEVQGSVINAEVLDEKMFELASRCEGLEISAMVQQETLKEVIALKHSNEVELKKKLDDFENENGRLRTNLMALSPLFVSLGNGISTVEENVCQLAKLHENQESPSHQQEDHETSIVDRDHSAMEGVFEMQCLIAKVESLQKLVMGTKSHLDQKKLHSDASLESARREIEELKLKESSIREVNKGMDSSTPSMVKDIELDQVSNSCGFSSIQSAESNDQMVKLCESPERDFENRISTDHGIELVEEVKSQKPSSVLVSDKDLGVFKLEKMREIKKSQDEWNRIAIKRLAIHADKLSVLQASAQELKLKMERSDTRAHHNKLQFDTIRANLKDAEAAISDLLDRNAKLTMMVELYANSLNDKEIGFTERKQVSEHIRSGSDRIGVLELELQKIDYIFLKLQEESESYSTRGGDRTPRMLLRDYLYGRKDKKGRKKDRFCGCVRPRINDD